MKLLAALLLSLPSAAFAAPSAESAAAGSMAAFQSAALPAPMLQRVAAGRRPMIASFDGSFSGSKASLTLDRRAWTVVGSLSGQDVKVAIDNDAKTIKGSANGAAVDMTFLWSPGLISYRGAANGSSVSYTVDFDNGIAYGSANGSPVRIEFNVADGTVNKDRSYANGWPVDLALEPVSGKLTGSIGGRNVEMTLVNADLSDFLQNLYLFLRP
jgi:hypothetical protein